MLRPIARRAVSALTAALTFIVLPAALTGCSRTVDATYPGSNVVQYPWLSCGTYCERAFDELQTTHDPNGKDCEDLVNRAQDTDGGDDRVAAAALFDSAVLLILRGKNAEAGARIARAEALDPDPQYKQLETLYSDSARRFLPPGR